MKKKFEREIIFSKTPLKTHFRFKDLFQIFPCEYPNAPKSQYADDFPLIIEYWIDEDENPELSEDYEKIKWFAAPAANKINRLNKLTRLLTSITNHRFFSYQNREGMYGMVMPDGEIDSSINDESPKWILPIIAYPDYPNDMKITEFSKQIHSDSEFIEHKEYFVDDPIDDKKKVITFPNSIHQILTNYFDLTNEKRKIIDAVNHLISNGIEIKFRMKSISFLTFVSSIETIINLEYKINKLDIEIDCDVCQSIKSSPVTCPKCGKPVWGIAAKFREFCKKYIAQGEESFKKYKRIYNLRSQIAHSGELLLGDEQTDWTFSEATDSHWMIHLETMQLARLSVCNWLISRSFKENQSK